jgi:hypothetical protein
MDQIGNKAGIYRLTARRRRLRFSGQCRLRLAVKRRSYFNSGPRRSLIMVRRAEDWQMAELAAR